MHQDHMTVKSPVWLHSASVVILAESHNPTILNRDFLVIHEIVPKEWEVLETAVTPPLAIIQYANGIRLEEDEHRLQVTERCDMPFDRHTNDRLNDLAASYVEVLPHVPYRGLGLNYTVSATHPDPHRWINERFLKFNPWMKGSYMTPRFSVDVGDATLNLSIYGRDDVLREGSTQKSIIMDYNIHHERQFDAGTLCHKIRDWKAVKESIVDSIDRILGD